MAPACIYVIPVGGDADFSHCSGYTFMVLDMVLDTSVHSRLTHPHSSGSGILDKSDTHMEVQTQSGLGRRPKV